MSRVRSDSSVHPGMSSFGFIIGTGRCGTTMIAQFLNAHSLICVPPELQIIFGHSGNGNRLHELFASGVCREFSAREFIDQIEWMCPHKLFEYFDYRLFFERLKYPITDLSQLLREFYVAIASSGNKRFFFEQVPWYGQRLDILSSLFPDAKYIHMIRDGRDVALSYARTSFWHDSLPANLERWHYEILKTADDAASILDRNQYIEIRYEDFVHDPKNTLCTITDFLGIEFEQNMLMHKNHIDYTRYRKFDIKLISSAEYNNWKEKRESGVFSDNVFGWKKNAFDAFRDIPHHIKLTLSRFGYEV